jgi:hypothetical protein
MHHINRQHHDEKNLCMSAVFTQRQKHQKIVKNGVFGGSEKRVKNGPFWTLVYTGECGRFGPGLIRYQALENRQKTGFLTFFDNMKIYSNYMLHR